MRIAPSSAISFWASAEQTYIPLSVDSSSENVNALQTRPLHSDLSRQRDHATDRDQTCTHDSQRRSANPDRQPCGMNRSFGPATTDMRSSAEAFVSNRYSAPTEPFGWLSPACTIA